MTRFDAPPSTGDDALLRRTAHLATARFGIVLACWAQATVLAFAAIVLLDLASTAPVVLRQAFAATDLLVFVAPAASRADAEALGARLTALPHVAGASLRRKEDALAALVATGAPAPADGRNPLPDLWTVSLRSDGPFFTTDAVAVRDAAAALASVDQVRYDEAWVAAVDRAAAGWSRYGAAAVAASLAAIAAAAFCLFVLTMRALAPRKVPPDGASAAVIGAAAVVAATIVAWLIGRGLVGLVAPDSAQAVKTIADGLGQNLGRCAAATLLAGLALGWSGLWAGAYRHSLDRSIS